MKETCGMPMYTDGGYSETLVGFSSPPGHDHDDNCRVRIYRCEKNHIKRVSIRRRCHKCDWLGKAECFCHEGSKVDDWPDVIQCNALMAEQEPKG